MTDKVNYTPVLTFKQAEQVFVLSPGQSFVRGGRLPMPFVGEVRDRPLDGQIWPRGEYEVTSTVGSNQPEAPKFAATVTVTPAEFSIDLAGPTTQQLTARAFDIDGVELFGHAVSWATSDPTNATVSQTGLVSPVSTGDATIFAIIDGAVGTSLCHVFATPPAVATVTVTPNPFAVTVGGTRQLTARTFASGGEELLGRTVTWGSSNTAVATVSASGLVTGVAVGTVTITATSETIDGTTNGEVFAAGLFNPLHYWPFDDFTESLELARDLGSATGFALRPLSGQNGDWDLVTGRFGDGVDNDGLSYFQPLFGDGGTPSAIQFAGNADWSVAVWFNRAVGVWALDRVGGIGPTDSTLLDFNGVQSPQVNIGWSHTLDELRIAVTSQTTRLSTITGAALAAGWNHIAITNNVAGNQLRFYLNGVLKATVPAINVANVGNGIIAWTQVGNNSVITSLVSAWGSMDELYIFDVVLTSAQVIALATV